MDFFFNWVGSFFWVGQLFIYIFGAGVAKVFLRGVIPIFVNFLVTSVFDSPLGGILTGDGVSSRGR